MLGPSWPWALRAQPSAFQICSRQICEPNAFWAFGPFGLRWLCLLVANSSYSSELVEPAGRDSTRAILPSPLRGRTKVRSNSFQTNLSSNLKESKQKSRARKRGCFVWCLEAESNHRHEDFQSSALPTELSRHQAAALKPLGGIKSTAVQKIASEIRH